MNPPKPALDREASVERRLERPLLVAALLVIPALVLEELEAGATWRTVANVLNWGIWLAFATEVVIMLAVAADRRRWLATHPLELAIVILTPPFAPAVLQAFRAARLIRAFRLLRLLRLVAAAKVMRHAFSLNGLRWASVVTVLTVLAAGVAFAQIESDQGISDADGVWWAITTMTTVGYGDIYPQTMAGRVLAGIVMFVGIGFVALLTGAVAERFLAREVEADERRDDDVLARLDDVTGRLAALEAEVRRLLPRTTTDDR